MVWGRPSSQRVSRHPVRGAHLPIGGYCAMGEDEEATDSPANFNNKSVWARICVIAAGPVFNFILALICAAHPCGSGGGYDEPVAGKWSRITRQPRQGLRPATGSWR